MSGGDRMEKSRQDAWKKDEDLVLAEIVLRHIREGKTQLEAFKQSAERLKRTTAACGFRWNAALRKQHVQAIELAKEQRFNQSLHTSSSTITDQPTKESLQSAISILKKAQHAHDGGADTMETIPRTKLIELREENAQLKKLLQRYEEAWQEMGNIWQWIDETDKRVTMRKSSEH